MKQAIREQRIAVLGLGGVGGYLGGMLCRAFPHVTFAVRGSRGDTLAQNGLTLHSDYNGEIYARPERICTADELTHQDILFLCVKNYSLEEACRQIRHTVDANTIVIPVMNGVDPGDRVRSLLPDCTVIDSLIYIVAFANPDFSVTQQGSFAKLYIGLPHASEAESERVRLVSQVLSEAGIDHEIADDIQAAIWKKYMLNCAYNVATAYYDTPIGPIRSDPVRAKSYESLVWEAYAVACAKQIHIKKTDAERIIHRFYHEHAEDATSSLMRDFDAGCQSELDTFSGYLVREAKQLGVPAPVSRKMYEGLLLREQRRNKP